MPEERHISGRSKTTRQGKAEAGGVTLEEVLVLHSLGKCTRGD